MPFWLKKIKNAFLNACFPPACLYCQKNIQPNDLKTNLCADCLNKIIFYDTLFCAKCRARLPENKKICHKDALFILGAASSYDEPLKSLIHKFKYDSWARLALPLGEKLAAYLENLPELNQFLKKSIIIPIPLHPKRKNRRGFNQAELLGRIVAEKLNLPMAVDILTRDKETQSQAVLKDWEQRKLNVENCFKLNKPELITNKNIVIIDDVFTSGATMREAARALRAGGAKKIIALVMAKT